MLEGIQILIDRMEMFPDDFRKNGNLNDFLYILDDIESRSGTTEYYKAILTEEEITAFKQAALTFHRENFNRKVIEAVMQGEESRENRLLREMKQMKQMKQSMQNTTQTLTNAINNVFTNSGGGGSGTYATSTTIAPEILTGTPYELPVTEIGGGAFVTKTGALFTPANIPKKKKK
jgi:hypothetical protein